MLRWRFNFMVEGYSPVTTQCNSIREWRDGFGRQMFNLDFEPLSDAPFHASFEPMLDGMPAVRASFSPGLTVRSNELAKDGRDDLGILISNSRHLQASQGGRELQLRAGEATLLRVSDPGMVGAPEDFKFMSILVPRAELEQRVRGIGDHFAQTVPRRSKALLLLRSYIGCVEKHWPRASAEVRDAVRRHLTDLIVLAITAHDGIGESQASAVVAARTAAALDHIAAHFQDPGLSLAGVARRLGISPRYLQRILETSGTSFTERVYDLRLKKAFAQLTQAGDGPCRISDVAFEAGFSDISRFNRLFRSRFGDTPRGVRQRGTK
jgi:AraC-like DNA-binding protein